MSESKVEQSDFTQQTANPNLLTTEFLAALHFVFVLLLIYSFSRIPIPGVNEPHYLCKAKHFWNPQWCAGDLFLESSNPHYVFYVTFGWLTQFFRLETVAVIGRCVGLIPLAIGWQLLASRLTGRNIAGPLSVGLFLVLQAAGNWSGEWLVGGIESKVVAYGFLFWAMAQVLEFKIRSSALLAGLAISFHPVVGVWGAIIAAMATLLFILNQRKSIDWSLVPPLQHWCVAAVFMCLTAAPGLVTAAQAVFEGDADSTRIANLLQVGHRLAHHLDPLKFPKEAYRYFTLLLFIWFLLNVNQKATNQSIWWNRAMLASLFIAGCGIIIAWGPRPLKEMPGYQWRISALKFYPFRLSDTLVPYTVALWAAERLASVWNRRKSIATTTFIVLPVLLLWISLLIPGSDKAPSRMSASKRSNWVKTCHWIKSQTEADDLVYSFENQWAVKWFCERPEYVNFKDCPQDAESIIEWNQRRWVIARWRRKVFNDGIVSKSELKELSQKTDATVFICDRLGPIEQQPDYQNEDFRIYLVRE